MRGREGGDEGREENRTNLGHGEDFVFRSKSNGKPWEGWERGGTSVKALRSNISQYRAQDEIKEQNRMEWKRRNSIQC